jgi:hypothetical protein
MTRATALDVPIAKIDAFEEARELPAKNGDVIASIPRWRVPSPRWIGVPETGGCHVMGQALVECGDDVFRLRQRTQRRRLGSDELPRPLALREMERRASALQPVDSMKGRSTIARWRIFIVCLVPWSVGCSGTSAIDQVAERSHMTTVSAEGTEPRARVDASSSVANTDAGSADASMDDADVQDASVASQSNWPRCKHDPNGCN